MFSTKSDLITTWWLAATYIMIIINDPWLETTQSSVAKLGANLKKPKERKKEEPKTICAILVPQIKA